MLNMSLPRDQVTYLRARGVVFESGLTDDEIDRVESLYAFRFPLDLRAFIQWALPISRGWVNWRDPASEASIRERLDWPAEGMCFDIEHNVFWMDAWGPKPSDLSAAFAIARQAVAEAPTLIPIYSHRYIPSEPALAGNPVLSVHQTDIIYYGTDLADYFVREFEGYGSRDWDESAIRPIRFWDEIQG